MARSKKIYIRPSFESDPAHKQLLIDYGWRSLGLAIIKQACYDAVERGYSKCDRQMLKLDATLWLIGDGRFWIDALGLDNLDLEKFIEDACNESGRARIGSILDGYGHAKA